MLNSITGRGLAAIAGLIIDRKLKINSDTACWLWTGTTCKWGYGRIQTKDGLIYVHRHQYERYKGQIPKGLIIRHMCHVPNCCNPEHLLCGTQKENLQDSVLAKRQAYGERSGKTTLTEIQARTIKLLCLTGLKNVEVANRYNINPVIVSNIKHGKTWKYL